MPRKLLYKWDNLPATLVCPCATRTLFLPRAGLEGAGRWDPFVKQTVEQQNEQIKQYIKSFYVWLFSLNQNRSFLPDSEWLNSPDSNTTQKIVNSTWFFTSQYSKEPGISGFFMIDSSIKHSEEYSVLRCFLRYRRLFYAISQQILQSQH